jgi:hypothetical protein
MPIAGIRVQQPLRPQQIKHEITRHAYTASTARDMATDDL